MPKAWGHDVWRNHISTTLLTLAALAAPALATPSDEYRNVHSIAIVSALGNDVDMETFGVTIFGNADYTFHTDWNLDAQIKVDVTNALSARFTIKNVTSDTQELTDVGSGLFTSAWNSAERWVRAQPKSNGVDAYVVIIPEVRDVGGFEWRGVNVSRGLGMLGNDGTTLVGTLYLVVVLDAATGDKLDYGSAQYFSSDSLGNPVPVDLCSNTMWSDSEDKLTSEQRARLRQEVESLIGKSIAYTLASADLITKADAAADTATFATPGDPSCQPQ